MADKVRLQIPVDSHLADRVAELAALMERSQSWMVSELIDEALVNREKITEWFALRIASAFGEPVHFRRKPLDGAKVYLQVFLEKDIADQVEKVATEMDRTVSSTAAWLLQSATDDHAWIIRFATSRIGRAFFGALIKLHERWYGKSGRKDRQVIEEDLARQAKMEH